MIDEVGDGLGGLFESVQPGFTVLGGLTYKGI